EVPTLANVKVYKGAVSRFLRFVVKNSLKTETTAGANFNPLKKQKRYTIIRVVDEKLERLAAGVLQNQSDKLYILEKIEEINGLIVNLLK
ncbi:MAG: YaaR family protein, partial [Spirochaetales bacterium]|nr:YaaR family protein [Spirochaetales bacterium]